MEFLTYVQKYRVTICAGARPSCSAGEASGGGPSSTLERRLTFSGAAPLGEEMARAPQRQARLPVVQGHHDRGEPVTT